LETLSQPNDLTPEQIAEYQETIRDPVPFAHRVLGRELWECEIDILRSIECNQRTAIKSCHGVGKTFTLAIAALWWLARYEDGIVLTTAPTYRQVTTQLWSELHRLAARSRIPYPEFNQGGIKLRGEENFAMGLSTNRAENFQGYHGRHVLILADEAPGIESGIWDAIAGVAAGGQVHIVMAGNPTIPSGAFYDAFHRERGSWSCITMDAFDTPNLAGLTLEDLLALPDAELDVNPTPYLTTRRWVRDQYLAWWHGDEASSPNWMSRVRGQFPSQAINALFKLRWLEDCKECALREPPRDGDGRLIAGVDVGGGEAETVAYLCEVSVTRKRIVRFGAWRAEDTLDEVARFLDFDHKRLSSVRVDADGMGLIFGVELRKKGFPVELIHVGIPPESKPQLGPEDPAVLFVNRKAQYYQNLSDAFRRGEVEGLVDDITIGQLSGILYEIDSKGRIKIEPKEKSAARGVPSPDRAEALMLALGEAPRVYEFMSVRDLERPRVRGSRAEQNALEDRMAELARHGLRMGHGFKKGGAY
jgi:phage terminase large subunit